MGGKVGSFQFFLMIDQLGDAVLDLFDPPALFITDELKAQLLKYLIQGTLFLVIQIFLDLRLPQLHVKGTESEFVDFGLHHHNAAIADHIFDIELHEIAFLMVYLMVSSTRPHFSIMSP